MLDTHAFLLHFCSFFTTMSKSLMSIDTSEDLETLEELKWDILILQVFEFFNGRIPFIQGREEIFFCLRIGVDMDDCASEAGA
jgi:hypothetical protein